MAPGIYAEFPSIVEIAKLVCIDTYNHPHYTTRLKKQVQRHRFLKPSVGVEPSEGRRSIWRSALDSRLRDMSTGPIFIMKFLLDMWMLLDALTDCSDGIRKMDTKTLSVIAQMVTLRESKLFFHPLALAERLAALWHDIIFDFDMRLSSQAEIETMNRWLGVEAMQCEEYSTIYDPVEGDFIRI